MIVLVYPSLYSSSLRFLIGQSAPIIDVDDDNSMVMAAVNAAAFIHTEASK